MFNVDLDIFFHTGNNFCMQICPLLSVLRMWGVCWMGLL